MYLVVNHRSKSTCALVRRWWLFWPISKEVSGISEGLPGSGEALLQHPVAGIIKVVDICHLLHGAMSSVTSETLSVRYQLPCLLPPFPETAMGHNWCLTACAPAFLDDCTPPFSGRFNCKYVRWFAVISHSAETVATFLSISLQSYHSPYLFLWHQVFPRHEIHFLLTGDLDWDHMILPNQKKEDLCGMA